ncbi:hypothetical protein K505DRAFT_335802 [Melanomma pulvis-pyrius CBS 109.77]|uniref:Uncharacterized protein n=1 Tax=Melanomma pulvis-pyrius CBS 109.77 TaxID=1314802 RepID=A0A6A6XH34_9PLEO|nr:hypothetical protein K505DRAFT_335802 [Melanomma pulvis-pyrius CBS 109.77]
MSKDSGDDRTAVLKYIKAPAAANSAVRKVCEDKTHSLTERLKLLFESAAASPQYSPQHSSPQNPRPFQQLSSKTATHLLDTHTISLHQITLSLNSATDFVAVRRHYGSRSQPVTASYSPSLLRLSSHPTTETTAISAQNILALYQDLVMAWYSILLTDITRYADTQAQQQPQRFYSSSFIK